MSSKKGKAVSAGIKLVWQMDKWLLIHSCIGAMIESAIPFIGIFLSAYILDGLQAGEPHRRFWRPPALGSRNICADPAEGTLSDPAENPHGRMRPNGTIPS